MTVWNYQKPVIFFEWEIKLLYVEIHKMIKKMDFKRELEIAKK